MALDTVITGSNLDTKNLGTVTTTGVITFQIGFDAHWE